MTQCEHSARQRKFAFPIRGDSANAMSTHVSVPPLSPVRAISVVRSPASYHRFCIKGKNTLNVFNLQLLFQCVFASRK
jgi:hypothetical protein